MVHITGQESAASCAFIAADKSHNANMVYAVVKALIRDLKVKLQQVHFITDSPTSQYRNKTMFHLVATGKKLFGVELSWTYLEAGHGKGPCDSVGGEVKGVADQEVNKVHYIYITTNTIKEKAANVQFFVK